MLLFCLVFELVLFLVSSCLPFFIVHPLLFLRGSPGPIKGDLLQEPRKTIVVSLRRCPVDALERLRLRLQIPL